MARTKQPARKSKSTDISQEVQKRAASSRKRTAGEANVTGETSQAKRADIKQTVKPAASSSSSSIPQHVYAVVSSSMKVYPGEYGDYYGGDVERPEVVAVYSDLEDANRRVVREYEEWDGRVDPQEDNSFNFTGPSYEWQVDADNVKGGMKVAIEKWTLYGPGSEPVKERKRLIPGEEGFNDQESDD
ncbi:hypothetical protein HYFRA_00004804 [Hymenoscyphus fraxineus]|uniref:Uncharacterized protein n=1 Tax=Hymenoscyphus fraxineus TaxID=746836 RepID=A0A9N9KLI9_9HELO|nr:hypothetical protein HYFRA_00004804 [Hymenoscyphus fraxineus]